MILIEERVASLEAQAEERLHMVDGMRESIASLDQRMDKRFDAVDRRFDAVDRRFDAVDRRFDAVDRRFDAVDNRFSRLEDRMDRHFMWLVGLHVTTLITIVAALMARR